MTMSREWEDKPHTVRKFLQRIYFRKYCYLIYTKTLEKLNSKKADNSIEKWDKDLNRQITRENTQMAKKMYEKMLNIICHWGNETLHHMSLGKWNFKK